MGKHFDVWPEGRPRSLEPLRTTIYQNLENSANRFPDKPALIYYDSVITYDHLKRDVDTLAGYLTTILGIEKNDRVLLFMQNSPQFIIGYYAILRADAVVVLVNPMCMTEDVRHIADDTEAHAILCAQELFSVSEPLIGTGDKMRAIVATYGDYISAPTDLDIPDTVSASRDTIKNDSVVAWAEALTSKQKPGPHTTTTDDWAVLAYSSGTTGAPKGCLHTQHSINATVLSYHHWMPTRPTDVSLISMPLFHVTAMQNGMNTPVFTGSTMIVMTRWDRAIAASLIERYRVTNWRSITTMAIDFVSNPHIENYDLSSLKGIGGGGAQTPSSLVATLKKLTGLDFIEGYGLSETAAASHINPPERSKPQCMGIPFIGVDSRIIDPETLMEVDTGITGEIILTGPQLFKEYWRQPVATRDAFIDLDGESFFRTGDLGYVDEEGYFFFVDRLKRMINASGYKVWPAEVEALMHAHPDIQEVCIIASPDERRGETVKAIIIPNKQSSPSADEIRNWCREQMASYKVPRLISFTASLPRTGSGKVLWRALQESESLVNKIEK